MQADVLELPVMPACRELQVIRDHRDSLEVAELPEIQEVLVLLEQQEYLAVEVGPVPWVLLVEWETSA